MSDLMHIGRSGLTAYRTALGVVGENIANVDTAGYLRREVVLSETGVGGGVNIVDVTRAFDTLLVDRNRTALTNQAAAQTHLTHLRDLEERLLPGTDGVQQLLNGFFDALDGVALAPSDPGLRYVALSAGQTLAGGMADLARGLDRLAQEVQAENNLGVTRANALLQALAEVQGKIAMVDKLGAQNPLFDERDRLLDDLATLVRINVVQDDRGLAKVRLGAGSGGPVLLDGDRFAGLDPAPNGQIRIISASPDDPVALRMAEGGRLGGLAQAAGSVAQTIRDLDTWAFQFTTQMNDLHNRGLTLDGRPGEVMFTTTGWTQTAGALTRGDPVADLKVIDFTALPAGPLTLVYTADRAVWELRDATDTAVASGNPEITAFGLQMTLRGNGRDGDRIILDRVDGAARYLDFALTDPRAIAAAGPLVVSAAPANRGTAQLVVQPAVAAPTGLADLAALLSGKTSEFINPGVVGVIPAGGGTAVLSVQPRLATYELTLADPDSARELNIRFANTVTDIPLPAGLGLDKIVAGLNDGSLTGADGQRLRDLGLTASLQGATISLMVDEGGTLPLALSLTTTGGAVAAVQVATQSAAADLSVFTREGRQLSGPLLTDRQAAALLTPANGFSAGAVYRPVDQNVMSEFAGLTRRQSAVAGDYSLAIGIAGGLDIWASGTVPQDTPAVAIQYQADGQSIDVQLPAGADAARKAELLASAVPVAVMAQTTVGLDLPDTGIVSLRVAGANVTPIRILADLGTGGPAAIANAFNAVSGSTGILAELSQDGSRVMLVQGQGHNIALSQIEHSAALPVTVQRLAPSGEILAQTTITTSGDQSLRVSGIVTMTGVADFALLEDNRFSAAERDPFKNGLIGLQRRDAGSTVALQPVMPAGEDLAPRLITVVGGDGRLHTAKLGALGLDAAQIADGLLRDLRRVAPTSQLVGAPLPQLPPDGARFRVTLGDEILGIQMADGMPVVIGAEPGRISAAFDAANRLVIRTADGALDGSMLQLPADSGEAARFGFAPADAPMTIAQGKPFDPAGVPASFMVSLGEQTFQIDVTADGVAVPAGFPGTGAIDPVSGAVDLRFDAYAGRFGIPAQAAAARVGFDTADLLTTRVGDQLILTATDGRFLQVGSPTVGTGNSLRLTDRPNLDLLVVLDGDGALRLSGTIDTVATPPRAQEIRILDATLGRIGLFDTQSGAFLAERTLSPEGVANFGDFQIGLSRGFVDGDVFQITPNTGLDGDSTNMAAMANRRLRDNLTGEGGYGANFATIQQRVGGQVAATQMRVGSLQAESESAARALSNRAGVDLDAEAARMMQLQQAYQANAQSLKTARDIFETLLAAL